MEKDELDLLQQDLNELAEKWKLQHCAFCGKDEDNFIGILIGQSTLADIWAVTLNVGRLWQHFRGETRQILDEYER